MPILPLDIIINILCFLPAKTLVRFKCVSKSWQSLIDSPQFITLHLAHSLETDNLGNLSFLYHFCV
ncbi:hypothetical protein NC652_020994 [Populus alba x Populus x berolinensis]|uniref:F-box domain-containing protein n=1 Tax=Populus alba x Populus x berolinensis TaxID=444605 RepID=A0AAD6MP14_9ROSI|nr:hypothetical protein NC652_020994 [Populus alba x Populus x berolinensis]KAJ6989066.1 hypothetical protein NC653_021832 [Populus alba x Populus x berolinensis]